MINELIIVGNDKPLNNILYMDANSWVACTLLEESAIDAERRHIKKLEETFSIQFLQNEHSNQTVFIQNMTVQ